MLILAQHHRATSMGVDRPSSSWMYIFWAVTQMYYSRTVKKLLQPLNCMRRSVTMSGISPSTKLILQVCAYVCVWPKSPSMEMSVNTFSISAGEVGVAIVTVAISLPPHIGLLSPYLSLLSSPFCHLFFHLPSPPFSRAHLLFASVIWSRDQYV